MCIGFMVLEMQAKEHLPQHTFGGQRKTLWYRWSPFNYMLVPGIKLRHMWQALLLNKLPHSVYFEDLPQKIFMPNIENRKVILHVQL